MKSLADSLLGDSAVTERVGPALHGTMSGLATVSGLRQQIDTQSITAAKSFSRYTATITAEFETITGVAKSANTSALPVNRSAI